MDHSRWFSLAMAALSSLVGPKPTGALRLGLSKMTVAIDGPLDVTVAIPDDLTGKNDASAAQTP